MKLLRHESMTTSQRYVAAAGTETRSAAARNPCHLATRRSGARAGRPGPDSDPDTSQSISRQRVW